MHIAGEDARSKLPTNAPSIRQSLQSFLNAASTRVCSELRTNRQQALPQHPSCRWLLLLHVNETHLRPGLRGSLRERCFRPWAYRYDTYSANGQFLECNL